MYKIVIDTNVLIDALADKSSHTWQILDWAGRGDVQAFASEKIIKEYQLIIDREVNNPNDVSELQKFISSVSIAPVTHNLRVVKYDHDDDKFINLALSADANYIISSDSHLLEIGQYEDIKILKPTDFYYEYKGETSDGRAEWEDIFRNIFS